MGFSICITIYYSLQVCHPENPKNLDSRPCTSFIGDIPVYQGITARITRITSIIGSFIAHMFHILDMLSIFILQKFRFEPPTIG